jgi:protein TonB
MNLKLVWKVMLSLFMLVPLSAQQETKPVLLHKIEPQYTEEARAAKIQGPVTLSTVVRTDGSFSAIKVVSGLGHGLDEKAIEAVRQWRAKPAMKDGKPIESTSSVTVNFRL